MTSHIHFDSELQEQKKYVVQKLKRLGDAERWIGLPCNFMYAVGSMAHVRITGTMQIVPVRSIVHIPGYIADGARVKTAVGFIVTMKNDLGHPLGRGYMNPTRVTSKEAIFCMNDMELGVPLDILTPLQHIKEKVPREVQKAAKASGVSLDAVKALDTPSAREDLTDIPSLILKIFPLLTHDEITSVLYTEGTGEELFDMSGESHKTVVEVDKANAILRHKMFEAKVLQLVDMHIKNEMKTTRKAELARRKK